MLRARTFTSARKQLSFQLHLKEKRPSVASSDHHSLNVDCRPSERWRRSFSDASLALFTPAAGGGEVVRRVRLHLARLFGCAKKQIAPMTPIHAQQRTRTFSCTHFGTVMLGNRTRKIGESAAAKRHARNSSCFHDGSCNLLRKAESAAPTTRNTLSMLPLRQCHPRIMQADPVGFNLRKGCCLRQQIGCNFIA